MALVPLISLLIFLSLILIIPTIPKAPISLQDAFFQSVSTLGLGYIANIFIELWKINQVLVVLIPLIIINLVVLWIKRVKIYYAVCSICYDDPAARRVSPTTTDDPGEHIDGSDHDSRWLKQRRIKKLNKRTTAAWKILKNPSHIVDNKVLADLEAILAEFGVTSSECLRGLDQESVSRIASFLKIAPKNTFIELMDVQERASDDSSSDGSNRKSSDGRDSDGSDGSEENRDSDTYTASSVKRNVNDIDKSTPFLITRRQSIQQHISTSKQLEASIQLRMSIDTDSADGKEGRVAKGFSSNSCRGKAGDLLRPAEETQRVGGFTSEGDSTNSVLTQY